MLESSPWVAVELNPSYGHVENPFLASMNPEQMHRLHRRIRQLESVGEGHPDKIADQVSNAFPRLLLRRRYFGGNVMSPGQVAQFERVAKECQYERKYPLHDGASLKLAREQPIPPASPIRDLMFKVACETATKAAQTVMVAGSSQDTEDLKELDCISWSSCGTCARIAKECQYERKYRKPHTNVSEVDLKQFEF
ncbi:VID27 cytoplasmic protein [Colletotrichum melonis]|uniref:VID27 cytoplasmic protein n=1 Tax=Colletotrichum melonis TaxID=1209925 RepID=A0AAI9UG98_9PEZI|nr:VID27 cytoplasmic protein [Colletotrichum melonis]